MSVQEAHKKEMLRASVEERVRKEERAHRIVERMVLTDVVEQEFFVSSGRYITISQYKDVIEERAITRLCGYPMCNTHLTQVSKQKYKISLRDKKVYDITERKNFCSNKCYKASKYYESQLSAEPVWTRNEKKFSELQLYSEADHGLLNSAWTDSVQEISLNSDGDVVFDEGRRVKYDEESNLNTDDHLVDVEHVCSEGAFGDNDCERIRVNDFENSHRRNDDPNNANVRRREDDAIIDEFGKGCDNVDMLLHDLERGSRENNQNNEDRKDSDDESNDSDDESSDSDKIDISDNEEDTDGKMDNQSLVENTNHLSETLKLDEKKSDRDRAIFNKHGITKPESQFSKEHKTRSEKQTKQNAKQTILLDSLKDCHIGGNVTNRPKMVPSRTINANIVEKVHKILNEWCTNETRKYIAQRISLAKEHKDFNLDESHKNDIRKRISPKKRILLPSVHSKNPVTIRGKIVSDKLKKAINPIFAKVGLTFHDIFSEITNILRTLSFTGVNIVLKPAEWTLVGFTMIYILMTYVPALITLTTSQNTMLRSLLDHDNVTEQDLQRLVDIFIRNGEDIVQNENNKINEFDMEELD